ncbi:MAG: transposase [Phormidesmis sp.]
MEPTTLRGLLKQKGYDGSLRTVQRYVRSLRQAQGLPVRVHTTPSTPKVSDLQAPLLTPKRAAYLMILRPENQCAEKRELLERVIQQCPSLAPLFELAESFLQLLRKRQSHEFDDWLLKAAASPIKPIQTFAKGLLDDYAAVKASMDTDWSNGVVEGLNNKLKMLKRQMYGRAGLSLLSKRLIAT